MKYYTGIGSRQTPADIRELMTTIAQKLYALGFILRSGGAPGADTAFESGVISGRSEIYLPWGGFNGHLSPLLPSWDAFDMAAKYHPAWNRLSPGARRMHARNCHQVLGKDLNTPSEFVICWTPNASGSGGTGQAIRIANDRGIPVWDLANPQHLKKWTTEN